MSSLRMQSLSRFIIRFDWDVEAILNELSDSILKRTALALASPFGRRRKEHQEKREREFIRSNYRL
jgi:hypothetical protein